MSSTPPSGPRFVLTLWTDDPERARAADAAGVDRIGLDLERIGKRERQADPRLWQTTHEEGSLRRVGRSLARAKLFARTNPPHEGWEEEAERLMAAGAEVLMLPAFRSAEEVDDALAVVGDRALLVPLIETAEALAEVRAIASIDGLREAHFGLNDLAIVMRLENRFDVLGRPELEAAAHALADAGLRVGVGGIGRALDDSLPIPSDRIYSQYPRLRASAALIARSFFAGLEPGPAPLAAAVAAARERLEYWHRTHEPAVEAAA